MDTQNTQNNAAKFAFFYMLSLVALVFMALSTGMIIFQIINKSIVDVLRQYSGHYSPDQLKFAISAIIISAPIFYILMYQIHKSLFSGALDRDSGIRKWLTYFILFVSSVVMLGWLIATINSFLDGELTTKFILKSITAIGIAAAVFTFYFYDIRREEVAGKKDILIRIYFYGSLAVVIGAFAGSLFFVESPAQTRNRKFDNNIIRAFSEIDGAINSYYADKQALPKDLAELKKEFPYITDDDLTDPETKQMFEYHALGDNKYELCATFRTSNLNDADIEDSYYKDRWPHDSGRQCLTQKVIKNLKGEPAPKAIR